MEDKPPTYEEAIGSAPEIILYSDKSDTSSCQSLHARSTFASSRSLTPEHIQCETPSPISFLNLTPNYNHPIPSTSSGLSQHIIRKPYFRITNFNAEQDVHNLIAALDKKSSEEFLIILCKRTRLQRDEISELYFSITNERLVTSVKNNFPFSQFRLFILGLTVPYFEYLARTIHNRTKHFHWMYYLLFTIPQSQMEAMKSYFFKKYCKNVNKYVEQRMKKADKLRLSVMKSIKYSLKYERNENSTIDQNLIIKDIQDLNELRGSSVTSITKSDINRLNEIFLTRSFHHIKLLCEIIFSQNDQTFLQFFNDISPNQNLYRHIAEYAIKPERYLAKTLFQAFRGIHSDVIIINHLFISRAEIDLHSIKVKFKQDFGEDLDLKVNNTFSGWYRIALLQLLNKSI